MGCAFRDMTDGSGPKSDPSAVHAQSTVAAQHVTHDVLIRVTDLFGIQSFSRRECDETRAEVLFFETGLVADLLVDPVERFERGGELNAFHQPIGRRRGPASYLSVTAATISRIAFSACAFGTRQEPTTLWPPPP